MTRRAQLVASIAAAALLAGCTSHTGVAATTSTATTPASTATAATATAALTTVASASTEPSPTATVPTGPLYVATATCPSPTYLPIYGPHVVMPTNDLPRITRPFGDVGVDFGPPGAGTTTVRYRLEVIVKRRPIDPTLSAPSAAYVGAISALSDSYQQLAKGTDPHVARVTLERLRQGPFVLPAAVLNALPKDRSYTVYLVSGGDMSHCSFDYVSSQLQGAFPIADLFT